jgi:hypothetical protein
MVHRRARPEGRRRRRRPFVTGPALRGGDRKVVGRLADRRQTVMAPTERTGGGRRNRRRVCAVIRRR